MNEYADGIWPDGAEVYPQGTTFTVRPGATVHVRSDPEDEWTAIGYVDWEESVKEVERRYLRSMARSQVRRTWAAYERERREAFLRLVVPALVVLGLFVALAVGAIR